DRLRHRERDRPGRCRVPGARRRLGTGVRALAGRVRPGVPDRAGRPSRTRAQDAPGRRDDPGRRRRQAVRRAAPGPAVRAPRAQLRRPGRLRTGPTGPGGGLPAAPLPGGRRVPAAARCPVRPVRGRHAAERRGGPRRARRRGPALQQPAHLPGGRHGHLDAARGSPAARAVRATGAGGSGPSRADLLLVRRERRVRPGIGRRRLAALHLSRALPARFPGRALLRAAPLADLRGTAGRPRRSGWIEGKGVRTV
ncbi:MAG: hypothetical protein AVDCRST_MAG41-4144, partial [uncultured Corynebacteriales bacterium]